MAERREPNWGSTIGERALSSRTLCGYRSKPVERVGAQGVDADLMRETLERYLDLVAAGDVDGVVDLMSDEVSVEDPVGGPPATHVVGKDKVRAFFSAGFAHARPRPTPTGPVRTTAGSEAAMPFRLVLTLKGRDVELDVIDVVRFDDAGRIVSLRAFWNPAELRDPGA